MRRSVKWVGIGMVGAALVASVLVIVATVVRKDPGPRDDGRQGSDGQALNT